MKKLLIYLLCFLCLWTAPAAQADGFQSNLEGVNEAAQSVLMLYVYDANGQPLCTGSGFVVFNNRTLVTNYHVIENAAYVYALSDTGDEYRLSSILAADAELDLALLHFDSPTELDSLPLAQGSLPLRGAPVTAIGSPQGQKNTVSFGNISGYFTDNDVDIIQFTAPISSGSSGGALFDNDGRVLGVTSATLIDSQNMNFAVEGKYVAALAATFPTGFTGIPLENYFLSSAAATPAPTLKPTPAPTATPIPGLSDLQASPLGFYSALLTWEGNPDQTYYIGYTRSGDSIQWYEKVSGSLKHTLTSLIPGNTYELVISTSLTGLDKPSVSRTLTMPTVTTWKYSAEIDPYYLGLSYCKEGADLFNASRTKSPTNKLSELETYATKRDYYLIYAFHSDKLAFKRSTDLLFVIYAPDGNAYVSPASYDLAKGSTGYKLACFAEPLFDKIKDDQKTLPLGKYALEVYMDGRLAYTDKFEVKK